jgi:hypothetical protein
VLPGVGADAADPAAVRLREQAPEVPIRAAVGVLEQQRGRDSVEHLVQPALVIARLVGRNDEVQPAHAGGPQLAVDPRLGRAAIEQHGRARTVLDQRGIALADVEKADGEGVGRRGRGEHGARGEHERSRDQQRDARTK